MNTNNIQKQMRNQSNEPMAIIMTESEWKLNQAGSYHNQTKLEHTHATEQTNRHSTNGPMRHG